VRSSSPSLRLREWQMMQDFDLQWLNAGLCITHFVTGVWTNLDPKDCFRATIRHVGFRSTQVHFEFLEMNLCRRPLRPPLSLTSLCQIVCSSGRCAKHYPPAPWPGFSCATILLCDLRPSAARALTSRRGLRPSFGGSLLASTRRANLKRRRFAPSPHLSHPSKHSSLSRY